MKEIQIVLPAGIVEAGTLSGRDVLAVVTNVGLPGPPGTFIPPVRQMSAYTSAPLVAGASEQGRVFLTTGFKLLHVALSGNGRIRLYTTPTGQAADVARLFGVNPLEGVGCIFDWKSNYPTLLEADITPIVEGYSMETIPSVNIPITITGTDPGPVAITATFTYVEVDN